MTLLLKQVLALGSCEKDCWFSKALILVQKKTDAKKRPDDEKKKRERQERAERMARQAAEREAALAKAKAARERKGAS